MAAAVGTTATVVSPAECEADGEGSGVSGHLPVFDAFDALGLTGRDIAGLARVSPPTVSKWRTGKARIPGEQLAFVSLVLAHILDEADESKMGENLATGRIEAARAQLIYQDVLNRDLSASAVRAGAQRFRVWWSSGAAQKLQDKRFQRPSDAEVLDVLKKMRNRR